MPRLAALFVLFLAGCGMTTPSPPPSAGPEVKSVPGPQAATAPKAAPTRTSTPTPAPAKMPTTPHPAAASAPPPLDLDSLEQRLKDTSAIGVLTKLSLKNQVDDLVAKFRSYHSGSRPPTLTDLRPSFDLLLMKVLSLLQDKDAGLARDINASRDAIWGVLSDKAKFAKYA